MLVIKVWCLPAEQTEEELHRLHESLVAIIVSYPELGVAGESGMLNLFPSDRMHYGLGSEIFVEVSCLFDSPRLNDEVLNLLAEDLGKTVKGFYPAARVQCLVPTVSRREVGFWSSNH